MSHEQLRLYQTPEFNAWLATLNEQHEHSVHGRLRRLIWGAFGDSRSLGDGLFELRWRNGLRVYFTRKRIGDIDTIVLYGGFKGTQHGDIIKSRNVQAQHEERLRGGRSDA